MSTSTEGELASPLINDRFLREQLEILGPISPRSILGRVLGELESSQRREQLAGIRTYKHHAGGTFVLLGVATDSTNRSEGRGNYAVYYSIKHGVMHVRELREFVERVEWSDGVLRSRFEPIVELPEALR